MTLVLGCRMQFVICTACQVTDVLIMQSLCMLSCVQTSFSLMTSFLYPLSSWSFVICGSGVSNWHILCLHNNRKYVIHHYCISRKLHSNCLNHAQGRMYPCIFWHTSVNVSTFKEYLDLAPSLLKHVLLQYVIKLPCAVDGIHKSSSRHHKDDSIEGHIGLQGLKSRRQVIEIDMYCSFTPGLYKHPQLWINEEEAK